MLALIAGTGALPRELVRHLPEPPLVCALEGFLPDDLRPDAIFRLERLGSFLAGLRDRGVTRLCLAGAIRRVALDPAALDAATQPLVAAMRAALAAGDDGALRVVIAILEQEGFEVVAAHAVAPALLPGPGCPTAAQPDARHRADAVRGAAVVAAMGRADIGQSCAVLDGQALAVEAGFGTDWMLQGLVGRPDAGGGILYKAPKPGQDRRADLPVIGPATSRGAAAAGLDGIVIEAGGVMVLERGAVVAECDRLGLFLWVRDAG